MAGLLLGRLFVYRTQVADLTPLTGMPTLRVLNLGGCPVRDLTPVTTLPALHYVNLASTPISDLGDLPARLPRVIWAVHYSLGPGFGGIMGGLSRNTLGFFTDDGWDEVSERLGGLPPDRFVHSVGGDASYRNFLLDLDVLDAAGNPTVVCWDFKQWQVGGHQQFWDWLDGDGVELAC